MRASFAVALGIGISSIAHGATPFSTDVTDLWWNPDESGWGVNLIQQGNVIFATFFVYGADGKARWFVAPDMTAAQAPSDQPYRFEGTLMETTGPVFSTAFNPDMVVRRNVGSVIFLYGPPNSGTINYSVDGVSVGKQIRRQTWRTHDLSGDYRGFRMLRPFVGGGSCPGAADTTTPVPMNVVITHSGGSATIRQTEPPHCLYSGTYSQAGRMGKVEGSYSCADGNAGTFTLDEIEVGVYGYSAKINQRIAGCNWYGHMGGMRSEARRVAD